MKKITLLIAALYFIVGISRAQKAFEKGNFTISLGTGFAVYGTQIHNEYNSRVWTGLGTATTRVKKDTSDGAVSVVYPVTIEYGLKNWLGIGAHFEYAKYIGGKDSVSGVKNSIRGIDGAFDLYFHFIKTKHFDLPLALTVGYSNFKLKSNDSLSSMAKDNGLNYGVSLVPRIYFGSHIGLYFNIAYRGYDYPSIVFSNKNSSNLNIQDNKDQIFKLKTSGVNLGLGLVIKF